ncbi:MAG TPA: glucoamylase family protein, partial [Bdellovibrio sp.]|nr:glucoamylase family protein [Bdellovibrio sp.]
MPVNRKRVLVSWSASMFEYLMPSLVMKSYENTLLTETLEAVVDRQIHYGKKLKVPWGVSEAGYNARDMNFNYQYGPFGIPSMGLKRGLAHDLVISPYSSFLAAIIDSERALKNLRVFEKQNLQTEYGFYESIDYTPERVGENQKFSVIKSFMAHHQGMSLIAIDNVLHRNIMQRRFHSEISVKATQLLLQESVPQRMPLAVPRAAEIEWAGAGESLQKTFSREFSEAESPTPRVQILSNGKYSLMITSAGSGYSKCGDIGTYRWREDGTCDGWGNFIFVSDINRAAKWSCTLQPFLRKPESYKVTFAEDKVDFRREDQGIFTECQVIVAPEENVEIRHVRLVNRSQDERILELTSYLEPVLAPLADDRSHPAFGNLFVQTEFVSAKQALLAKRRPRLAGRKETWGIHVLATDKDPETAIQYETDRFRFVGRGRSLNNPQALDRDQELSGSVGSTLEPSLSLRIRLRLAPGEMTRVAFTTGIAQTREEALLLADKYHEISSFERESKLAWTKSRIDLRHLGLDSDSAYLFQSLAERILYLDPALRLSPYQLAKNTREQASLWPYGIGGDNPIVAITVNDKRDISIVRKLLRGHEYLRLKGLVYDFVVLNNSKSTYLQELQEELQRQVRFSGSGNLLNQSGGIFVLRMDAMPEKDRHLIQAMARVAIFSDEGSLKDQIRRKGFSEKYPEAFIPSKEISVREPTRLKTSELVFFNGLGGFSADGREYVIKLETGQNTPCPWINVVANAHDFGFQVSEGGSGYTWSINSRENRLTNWSNDPVTDPSSEIFYLRDEETGEIWTP